MYVNKEEVNEGRKLPNIISHFDELKVFYGIATWETKVENGIKFQVVRLCRSISNDYESWYE